MAYNATRFRDIVLNDYDRRAGTAGHRGVIKASAGPVLEARSLGHPLCEPLAVGQQSTLNVASAFLDLTNFTGRTFWDDQLQVSNLAHAVLTGFVDIVTHFGGYPLGLRGDGLFAAFGPHQADVDVTMALSACAYALRAVEEEVNPALRARGIEPVQARAGLDFGPVTFIRSGNRDLSEVNAIGFSANFAAKCEKTAKSWEIVAGQTLVNTVPGARDLFVKHAKSPKTYDRNYERRTYDFYDYRWRRLRAHLDSAAAQLATRTPNYSIG